MIEQDLAHTQQKEEVMWTLVCPNCSHKIVSEREFSPKCVCDSCAEEFWVRK